MIVLTLTNISVQLRGYLTRYLVEIDTGQYVGVCSARVRDALWNRVKTNIEDKGVGHAVIVWDSDNEQGFSMDEAGFADRKIVSFDGMLLIEKIRKAKTEASKQFKYHSNAYWWRRKQNK